MLLFFEKSFSSLTINGKRLYKTNSYRKIANLGGEMTGARHSTTVEWVSFFLSSAVFVESGH